MHRWGGLAVVLLVALPHVARAAPEGDPFPAPPTGNCSAQMLENPDDCCWPGQKWSKYLEVCVGTPRCPDGYRAVGETCKSCDAGQVSNADTAGRCCWPGQVWSELRKSCVGIPRCPAGKGARGEACEVGCADGQVANADTAGRCCWPGQAWSKLRGVCVGVPRCPAGRVAVGEECVAVAAIDDAADSSAAPGGSQAVLFAAADGATRYQLRVGDDTSDHSCATPCRLHVRPGVATLVVQSPGSFRRTIVVPDDAVQVRVSHLRTGRLAAGLVLLAAATAGIISGAWAINEDRAALGGALLVGGFVAGVVGIPLLFSIGRDAAEVDRRSGGTASLRPRLVGAGLAPTAGGGAAAIAFSF